jgi:acyl-CoA reductase-like NAD-dependent aldehyde dehydrogenase
MEWIMSKNDTKFYIDGEWVEPAVPNLFDVINPATEETAGQISLGTRKDVNYAVKAARRAFASYSATSREARIELLKRIVQLYEERQGELARAMTAEMGSPITFSHEVQTVNALNHFKEAINVLSSYTFERMMDTTMIRREPIGVCGLITPWNWPLNQVTSKLAPALAAGCTAVLKPSEIAPLSTILLAEILHDAGVPKGVFNLVNGDGPTVGQAISAHPDIDMVSFTGSTRASPRRRRSRSSASARNSAASHRTSSWKASTSKRSCRPACCAATTTPGSRARRPPACWSIVRSTTPRSRLPRRRPRAFRSAIRSTRRRRWDRSSARRSSTKFRA